MNNRELIKITALGYLSILLVGCGGGGGDSGTNNGGTAGTVSIKAGDLDGTYTCTGGPYSFLFLASGKCTDNQILQDTCQRSVSITGDKYIDYPGASSVTLNFNTGVIQGPDTKPYYYGKTTIGDRLIYERYLPVLRPGFKLGTAVRSASITETSGAEYSLDGSKNLQLTLYAPKPLPAGLTYSTASGGPGEIEITNKICTRNN